MWVDLHNLSHTTGKNDKEMCSRRMTNSPTNTVSISGKDTKSDHLKTRYFVKMSIYRQTAGLTRRKY